MDNIFEFNEACGVVFTMLYKSFPVPMEFDQREIGFYDGRHSDSEWTRKRRRILAATLDFLREEGLVTFKYLGQEPTIGVCDARLTSKGLARLQRIPDGIKEATKPLGEQLSEAMHSLSGKAAGVAMSAVITRIVGLVLG